MLCLGFGVGGLGLRFFWFSGSWDLGFGLTSLRSTFKEFRLQPMWLDFGTITYNPREKGKGTPRVGTKYIA